MNRLKQITWNKLTTFLYPVVFGIFIVVLWETEILHKITRTDSFILPVPSSVIQIIIDNSDKMFINAMSTISVAIIGLILGSLFGYFIAIIGTFFRTYGVGGLTVVSAFNAIPIVALAPVVSNWTADISPDAPVRSMISKIIVVTVMCTASMSVNAYRGLNELKPFSEDLMKSYACGKGRVLMKLRFPNSVPYIFIALRVSVPASVITTLVSEYFAEYITGVGRQIRENILIAQYATAWSYIFVACLIGILMFSVLMVIESVCLRKRRNN